MNINQLEINKPTKINDDKLWVLDKIKILKIYTINEISDYGCWDFSKIVHLELPENQLITDQGLI